MLSQGYNVIVLTRNAARARRNHPQKGGKEFAEWDVKKQTIDADAVRKANVFIHLAVQVW
jgi:nucleoside-diphosphate-sugar epimerase